MTSIKVVRRYLTRAEKYTPNPRKPNAYAVSTRGTSGPWQMTHPETMVHLISVSIPEVLSFS